MARVERELWKAVTRAVVALDSVRHVRRPRHSDAVIVLIILWARLHHQTIKWACDPASWSMHRPRFEFPDPSTISRRVRTASIQAMLQTLAQVDEPGAPLAYAVDGKPLVVSRHSTDRHARHGRGAGGMDKGYKLHLICDLRGVVHVTRVTPLNTPEQEIARRMVKSAGLAGGYLLGDTLYDWDRLHRECAKSGLRLLVHRRPSRAGRGTRERGVSTQRLDCITSTETPGADFAPKLLKQRRVIERVFARMETRWRIGHPPFHIRSLPRVRLWVTAAIILDRFVELYRGRSAA